jgi:hypothetical protein
VVSPLNKILLLDCPFFLYATLSSMHYGSQIREGYRLGNRVKIEGSLLYDGLVIGHLTIICQL